MNREMVVVIINNNYSARVDVLVICVRVRVCVGMYVCSENAHERGRR